MLPCGFKSLYLNSAQTTSSLLSDPSATPASVDPCPAGSGSNHNLEFGDALLPVHPETLIKCLSRVLKRVLVASPDSKFQLCQGSAQLEQDFTDTPFRAICCNRIEDFAKSLAIQRSFGPWCVGRTRSASREGEILYSDLWFRSISRLLSCLLTKRMDLAAKENLAPRSQCRLMGLIEWSLRRDDDPKLPGWYVVLSAAFNDSSFGRGRG